MSSLIKLVVLATVVLSAYAQLKAGEIIVPAGTILQCTLTDSNLSSKTAQEGEPILCDMKSLHEFGVTVFPRGAYVGGHFAESRDPGRFWGKGWIQLDFDRILTPSAEVHLSAKVISVPHLRVDTQGKIHGRGHARRDAVEWAIPVLWPVKILTLPMRGPRPALKSESRISLKLMDDVSVPDASVTALPSVPMLKPGLFRPNPAGSEPNRIYTASMIPEHAMKQPIAASTGLFQRTASISGLTRDPGSKQLTFLILKNGRGQLVTDYWFEAGQRIRFICSDGTPGLFPIGSLDLATTIQMNREHGVDFVVSSSSVEQPDVRFIGETRVSQ